MPQGGAAAVPGSRCLTADIDVLLRPRPDIQVLLDRV